MAPSTSPLPSSSSTQNDCVVCGDRSSGNHYGAVTCEGCKQFFKRWMQNPKNFICRQDTNQCEINVESRNSCQHCRLQKCLAEGMAGSTQSSRFSILLPPETSNAATAQDSEEYKPAMTLQDLLVEPKIEEDDYHEHPQIDLLSYEEEVEQAEAELTASSAGMQHFERLWKKETEEYLAKKAEFEEIEARYMERKEVYLEALDNKKRKLQNAKIDFEFKVQKLREAREADEGQYS